MPSRQTIVKFGLGEPFERRQWLKADLLSSTTHRRLIEQAAVENARQTPVYSFLGALCVLLGSNLLLAAVFSSDSVAVCLYMFAGMFVIVVGLSVWLAGASEEQIDRMVKRLRFLAPWLGFVIAGLAAAIFLVGMVRWIGCKESGFVVLFIMAWSPVRRFNAG
jgi:sulfite exporter TauE/SafE